MKKILALLLAATLVIGLAACGESSSSGSTETKSTAAASTAEKSEAKTETETKSETKAESTTAETETSTDAESDGADDDRDTIIVGFSVNDLNDINFSAMAAGQQMMEPMLEEELGVNIEAYWMDSEGSIETQMATVENLISLGCNAISILPVDTESCDNLFAMCNQANIPSMLSFFEADTDKADYEFRFLDNYQIGQYQAEWLCDWMRDNPDEHLNIAIEYGQPGVAETMKRGEAVQDVLAEYENQDQFDIVVTGECNNDAQVSQSLAEAWIQTYPEINCIVGYCDDMVWPMIQAYQAADYDVVDGMIFIGCDGTDYNYAVEDGMLNATVKIADFVQIAHDQFKVLCQLAMGETRETLGEYFNDSMVVIDKDNLAEYWTAEE